MPIAILSFILLGLFPLMSMAQLPMVDRTKPCVPFIQSFCPNVGAKKHTECLDQNRAKLDQACIKHLDARIAQDRKYQQQRQARQEAEERAKLAPLGECRDGKDLLCPMVDDKGVKRRAKIVDCPCHGDWCLTSGKKKCIPPQEEEQYAEDRQLSDYLAQYNYNLCLGKYKSAEEARPECDKLHQFAFKGIHLPPQDPACVAKFPIPSGMNKYQRASFRLQILEVCRSDGKALKSDLGCIEKKFASSTMLQVEHKLAEATLSCDKNYQACMKNIKSLTRGRPTAEKEFLEDSCAADASLPMSRRQCMAQYIRRGPEFRLRGGGPAWRLCAPENQACVQKLKSKTGTQNWHMLALDYACTLEKSEQQECAVEMLGRQKLALPNKSTPENEFRRQRAATRDYCTSTNDKAKICIDNQMRAGINVNDALFICKYATQQMRDCLSDYMKKKGPVAEASISTNSTNLKELAVEYCSVSDPNDQQCFLKNYLISFSDKSHEESLKHAHRSCNTAEAKCLKDYREKLPSEVRYLAEGNRVTPQQVCEDKNKVMKSCLFKKLEERWREDQKRNDLARRLFGITSVNIVELRKACMVEFTGNLVSEFRTLYPALGVRCE